MVQSSKFSGFGAVQQLRRRIGSSLKRNGTIPFFRPHLGVNGASIDLGNGPVLNFSGYNYLELSGHPEVNAQAKAAIDRYGTSAGASRIVSGEIPLHRELEEELADFIGAEACVTFVSGYNTNVSVIGHLYGRRDAIFYDEQAHNSIVKGSVQAQSQRQAFRHNDLGALRELLATKRAAHRRALIVTEGAYSMSGDVPDITAIAALCREFDADLMVDEAHSIGTLGVTGRGLIEHRGVTDDTIDIRTGTLSKAFASCGGFVVGDSVLVEYLRYSAPGFIFSVGLPPADAAAALASLRILRREPERVVRLQARARKFRQLLASARLPVNTDDASPIVPVRIGEQDRCIRVSMRLLEVGINVQPVVFPAVPAGEALLRFFVTCGHSESELERTAATLGQLVKESGHELVGA
jgi:8-amino-7-oxononanoate synthase